MELNKINEGYSFEDLTIDGWKTSGNVTKEVSGNININCDIKTSNSEYIGNFSYHKPKEGNISLSYTTSENGNTFGDYIDTIIDYILKELI